MDPVLNWKGIDVRGSDDVVVQLVGNADTELVTRYFWMPEREGVVKLKTDRRDSEPLTIAPSAMDGGLNKLGFVFNAMPLVPGRSLLAATVRVTQAGETLLEELIRFDEQPPAGNFIQYADGVQFRKQS